MRFREYRGGEEQVRGQEVNPTLKRKGKRDGKQGAKASRSPTGCIPVNEVSKDCFITRRKST